MKRIHVRGCDEETSPKAHYFIEKGEGKKEYTMGIKITEFEKKSREY